MKDLIYSTAYWDVILSHDQAYFGRLVIVCKADREMLGDIGADEQHDLFALFKKLEAFFKKEFNATMFNYSCLMNNAYRDGERARVHWHFRPRYKETITVLGEQFSDPNFGYHYAGEAFGLRDAVSEDIRSHIKEKLAANLALS